MKNLHVNNINEIVKYPQVIKNTQRASESDLGLEYYGCIYQEN